ncbi:circularly permutated Ras 1-like protein [Labeo rohita]|uniref:Circularly permutated Ras 1-like protein n=1 Tax=Labeo rohita TaxID=84645 RepID=A0A498MJI5_LABRO|nr:circularly permutated Ras 1-like protein [Labeo rohita]
MEMEFACSHVVCNWRSETLTEDEAKISNQVSASTLPCGLSRAQSISDHPYDNRVTFVQKPGLENSGEIRLKANVNVVSLKVGSLVDVSKASGIQSSQKPVRCGKCNAIMSSASSPETHQKTIIWSCEFCGKENVYPQTTLKGGRFPLRNPPGRDILYLDDDEDTDYENLDDMLIVLCVDISGSMSVTSEISPGNSTRSPTYVSRLQGVQEALQMVLSSLQKSSPHRRVALVTFNNEVTVYGDGTKVPLTLRDWALVDYDYLKKEGENYSTPHCIAETIQPLTQKIKELREHGATALGPAALISVAMASQFTGSKINIVNIGTVATEIQSAIADNVLATSVMATLLAPDGMYFPYEEDNHRLVREIGNVTDGVEITFQFAVRPEKVESSLNMSVLGVHCAQLCARLTMEGRVQEAQRQLRAQQDLLKDISQQKPSPKEESIYGNWISTMSMICEDLTTVNQNTTETDTRAASRTPSTASLSDAAAKVVYQMKRAKSVTGKGKRVAMLEN